MGAKRRPKRYRTIVADPPWSFRDKGTRLAPEYSGHQRKQKHYDTMPLADIVAMGPWVRSLATDDAFLVLWYPHSFMEAALAVCKAWGFAQRQALIWVKTTADGERVRFGGGHCFRLATEPALVAMRGKYSKHVLSHGEHNVVMAPRQAHSQKPDESYEKIMRVCPGPYLELFARRRYSPAWDVWGNEVNSDLSATFPSGV